jgi:holo-[acyl-carrier protein] synthase
MTRIFAIGCDIVDVSRIARLDARFGPAFRAKFLHPSEQRRASALPPAGVPAFLASRWAAKEALHKALRAAAPPRLLFPDMEVASTPAGAPFFVLHGAAGAHAAAQRLRLSVSLSHERSAAVAFVVAEQEEEAKADGRDGGKGR